MTDDLFQLEITDRTDLAHVTAHCTCGEFVFEGDWDDLCKEWFRHEADDKYTHLYITKIDHKGYSLISREEYKKMQEFWPDKFGQDNE